MQVLIRRVFHVHSCRIPARIYCSQDDALYLGCYLFQLHTPQISYSSPRVEYEPRWEVPSLVSHLVYLHKDDPVHVS